MWINQHGDQVRQVQVQVLLQKFIAFAASRRCVCFIHVYDVMTATWLDCICPFTRCLRWRSRMHMHLFSSALFHCGAMQENSIVIFCISFSHCNKRKMCRCTVNSSEMQKTCLHTSNSSGTGTGSRRRRRRWTENTRRKEKAMNEERSSSPPSPSK